MRTKEDYSVSPSNEKPVEEVNVHYEKYEEQPKRSGFLSRLFVWSKSESSQDYNEDDFSEEGEFNVEVEDVSSAVDEYEALEKEERAIEKKKDSLFARLFKRRTSTKVNEADFSEGVEVYDEKKDAEEVIFLKEDLKKLGIICYDLIKMLDESEFKRFKLSDDFNEYKNILKKHKLVRSKY